jgi:hypothetical protein
MRGDQPAREWRALRANKVGPNGLNVDKFAKRKGTGKRKTSQVPESSRDAKLYLYSLLLPRNAAKLAQKRIFTLQTPKTNGCGTAAMFPCKKGLLWGKLCLVGYKIG